MYTHDKPLHLSPYDHPDIYPGPSPKSSFLYYDGKAYPLHGGADPSRMTLEYRRKKITVEQFLQQHGAPSIEDRYPVLSYGSNICIAQLRYKYSLKPDVRDIKICLKGKIRDTDVIYAAFMTKYGAIPAMLAPMDGATCQVWLSFIDEQQLNHMIHTESGYSLAVHRAQKLRLENGLQPVECYACVYDRALTFDGSFHRFPDIPAQGSQAQSIWEAHMLEMLSGSFGMLRERFIEKVKTDIHFRRTVQDVLNILSIPVRHIDWVAVKKLKTWKEILA